MNRRIAFVTLLVMALVLMPGVSQARWMNPASGRFQTMDPYEGRQNDPQTLHRYTYLHDDPVNKVDPSGKETAVEIGTVGAMQANIAASVIVNVGLVYTAIKADSFITELQENSDIERFVRDHQSGAGFTQQEFEQLENRINQRHWSRKQLYLHYSFLASADSLTFGLWEDRASWATRTAFPTGWQAHWYLALPQADVQNAVYVVKPKEGFEPVYAGRAGLIRDEAGRLLDGGGEQWRFDKGSGGPGTVSNPMPIPVGAVGTPLPPL